jgi:hypothetical protein
MIEPRGLWRTTRDGSSRRESTVIGAEPLRQVIWTNKDRL